jgi:hypothetical protein
MNRLLIPAFFALASAAFPADPQWVLDQSSLTYHVSHPLHQSEGVSHAARGKGVCQAGQCEFLVAAPVKSFDSGDSNRDLHMIEVTRGAQFPMVIVRFKLPESVAGAGEIRADLDVEFAGQTAHYKQVAFERQTQGNATRIVGTVPATLTDFKIDPPSLMMMTVKNEIPVRVETTWHRE